MPLGILAHLRDADGNPRNLLGALHMAHKIDMSNGRANMAYAGSAPWHNLGTAMPDDAGYAAWRESAGLGFKIMKGAMVMRDADGNLHETKALNRSILYRDDTLEPLSVMSTDGFKVVQPEEILTFIHDTVNAMGWKMETAGSLAGGRKIWALANIGEQAEISTGDTVKGYLLAATACDGTMSTQFRFTTTRVVCNNTLHIATHSRRDRQPKVAVYHSTTLDVAAVKEQLGIAPTTWASFIEDAKRLAAIKLTDKKAIALLRKVYLPNEKEVYGDVAIGDDEFFYYQPTAEKVLSLYKGDGIGSQLASAKGTAWGLVNAATQYYDHEVRARSDDNRLTSAWFGAGASKKDAMFAECLALAD